MTRSIQLAEDLAQDALVAALEQWPETGVPNNPAAWLMTTAKRRGVDSIRRAENLRRKTEEIGRGLREDDGMPDLDAQVDFIEDDALRLIFLSCHPALTPESRAALTLRVVGGLTTAEIARGFLVPEKTMGQRISRAKKTLTTARAEFELPVGEDRIRRLDDVMAVIYLIFTEGYSAAAGDDWMRPDLAREGIQLADARRARARRARSPRTAGPGRAAGLPHRRPHGRRRRPRPARRPGPGPLGPAPDPAGPGRDPPGRGARRPRDPGGPVLPAGRDRRAARPRGDARRHRLDAHRPAVRRAGPGRARSGGGGQSGCGARPGVRPGCGPDGARRRRPGRARRCALAPSVRGDLLERAGRHAEAANQFDEAARRTRNAGERTLLERRARGNRHD